MSETKATYQSGAEQTGLTAERRAELRRVAKCMIGGNYAVGGFRESMNGDALNALLDMADRTETAEAMLADCVARVRDLEAENDIARRVAAENPALRQLLINICERGEDSGQTWVREMADEAFEDGITQTHARTTLAELARAQQRIAELEADKATAEESNAGSSLLVARDYLQGNLSQNDGMRDMVVAKIESSLKALGLIGVDEDDPAIAGCVPEAKGG